MNPTVFDPALLATAVADANLTMDDDPSEEAVTARALALLDAKPRNYSSVTDREFGACPAYPACRVMPGEASYGTHARRCAPLRALARHALTTEPPRA